MKVYDQATKQRKGLWNFVSIVLIFITLIKERFSIEYRRTKTKVITTANQKKGKSLRANKDSR